jgi:magnesium transporter
MMSAWLRIERGWRTIRLSQRAWAVEMSLERDPEFQGRPPISDRVEQVQSVPRHESVESIIQRQDPAELDDTLAALSAEEIGTLLEDLSFDNARFLWSRVPEAREDEVLREVSETLRERLTADRAPKLRQSQIDAFELVDGKLRRVEIKRRDDLQKVQPIWIDLLHASNEERAYVGAHFGLELPDPREGTDLEVSSRFHVEEGNEIHLHSNFLLDRDVNSHSVPVAFILKNNVLFSLRHEDLPVFRLQRIRVRAQPGYVSDSIDLLLDLYGADVEYSADALEDIYSTLGKVGRQVLSERMSDKEAAATLADIAEEEDLNGRVRSNILDTQRGLSFLMRSKVLSQGQIEDVRQILRDIDSLNSHTAFLFDKINFLMDATIGFININQNRRVSQLTVFGVVFMPLNIIAGIGGMSEFSMMTQGIPWPISYGAFTVGTGLLGWGMYVALKHFENRKLRRTTKAS